MKYRLFLAVLVGFGLICIHGCSNSPKVYPTHKVSGQVSYDGKPAVGVSVFLGPIGAPRVPEIPSNPRGVTDKDGRFFISTYGDRDGAPVGTYQVMMLWIDESSKEESKPDRFLGWYGGVHSTLKFEVREGDNTIPAIRVPAINRPPEQLQGIPGKN